MSSLFISVHDPTLECEAKWQQLLWPSNMSNLFITVHVRVCLQVYMYVLKWMQIKQTPNRRKNKDNKNVNVLCNKSKKLDMLRSCYLCSSVVGFKPLLVYTQLYTCVYIPKWGMYVDP